MLGWKLLLLLSQEAAPKADFVEFLVAFFRQGVDRNRGCEGRQEFAHLAKECFKALEKNLKELSLREQEILGYVIDKNGMIIRDVVEIRNRETVKIEVFLMDNSSRKLRCKKLTTVGELGLKMAELLRMDPNNSGDFGFFQLVEDVIRKKKIYH